jgi:hypothetical protein
LTVDDERQKPHQFVLDQVVERTPVRIVKIPRAARMTRLSAKSLVGTWVVAYNDETLEKLRQPDGFELSVRVRAELIELSRWRRAALAICFRRMPGVQKKPLVNLEK